MMKVTLLTFLAIVSLTESAPPNGNSKAIWFSVDWSYTSNFNSTTVETTTDSNITTTEPTVTTSNLTTVDTTTESTVSTMEPTATTSNLTTVETTTDSTVTTTEPTVTTSNLTTVDTTTDSTESTTEPTLTTSNSTVQTTTETAVTTTIAPVINDQVVIVIPVFKQPDVNDEDPVIVVYLPTAVVESPYYATIDELYSILKGRN